MNTVVRWGRAATGVAHGLISFLDVAKEAANLNVGVLARPDSGSRPREAVLL